MAEGVASPLRRSARRVTPGASQRFVAATEHLDSGVPVVSVTGEVDLATAPALEQTLLAAAEDRTGELIVDLTGCSFLDSRGLRALLATRARLEPTQCDDLFEIHPSLGAAVDRNGNGNGHA